MGVLDAAYPTWVWMVLVASNLLPGIISKLLLPVLWNLLQQGGVVHGTLQVRSQCHLRLDSSLDGVHMDPLYRQLTGALVERLHATTPL